MKKKLKWILVGLLCVLLVAGASGAAAWWWLRGHPPADDLHAEAAAEAPEGKGAKADAKAGAKSAKEPDKRPPKYVSLEKVIVMLRRTPGDSTAHYLAMDLVLKTAGEDEKLTKDHLPMLRSVAVRALANYTAEQAGAMSIDQVAAVVNAACAQAYEQDHREPPFSQALIGKLIVE
jgi:flagellar FliL protein